jgi:hypothetical protein
MFRVATEIFKSKTVRAPALSIIETAFPDTVRHQINYTENDDGPNYG